MPATAMRRRLLLDGAFSPRSLSGLKLWLAADRISGLADADPVATWADLSGNGNDATQATAAKRPTYQAGEINGHAAILGDGVDDIMGVVLPFTPSIAQPFTVACVVKRTVATAPGAGQDPWAFGRAASDTTAISLTVDTLNLWRFRWVNDAAALAQGAGISAANTSPHVIVAVFTGSQTQLYVDGGTPDTASPSGATTIDRLSLFGKKAATESRFAPVHLREPLAWDRALSSAELNRLGRYLAREVGIAWTAVA